MQHPPCVAKTALFNIIRLNVRLEKNKANQAHQIPNRGRLAADPELMAAGDHQAQGYQCHYRSRGPPGCH